MHLVGGKQKLTNFGLNVGEYGANVEGELLSKGTVFGDGDSLARIVKPLLHAGLSPPQEMYSGTS